MKLTWLDSARIPRQKDKVNSVRSWRWELSFGLCFGVLHAEEMLPRVTAQSPICVVCGGSSKYQGRWDTGPVSFRAVSRHFPTAMEAAILHKGEPASPSDSCPVPFHWPLPVLWRYTEPRTLHMLHECSAFQKHPQLLSPFYSFINYVKGVCVCLCENTWVLVPMEVRGIRSSTAR